MKKPITAITVHTAIQWTLTFINKIIITDRGFVYAIAHIRGGEDLEEMV
jgi:protease II